MKSVAGSGASVSGAVDSSVPGGTFVPAPVPESDVPDPLPAPLTQFRKLLLVTITMIRIRMKTAIRISVIVGRRLRLDIVLTGLPEA